VGWFDALLRIDILHGPVIVGAYVLSAAAVTFLLLRRPSRRWLVTVMIALGSGGLVAVLLWFFLVRVFNVFGMGLVPVTYAWLGAACAAVGLALVNLWKTRPGRRSVAAASVLLFVLTGALGINAGYGLDRTVGAVLGITALPPITLTTLATPPNPQGAASGSPSKTGDPHPDRSIRSLWQTWSPPADLPAAGNTGSQVIPNTVSGFASRPAGIYLPPAALVPNAPALPLVIMLMGQPGNPDPEYVAASLDRAAAQHGGLAPIVVVADQLGDPGIDPLCLDTAKYGKAETYLTRDVVDWASANLNVTHDHRYWTIAGFSNGGQCAIALAAKHPDIWSNVIDVSGESFPGSEIQDQTLNDVFGGNQAAYDAQKPVNLLSGHRYPATFAIFTCGAEDPGVAAGQQMLVGAAQAAGMTAVYAEIPGVGHEVGALSGGLDAGFDAVFPRLGLAPPS
jgi:poly(3-hydroxybutyrate) depolymerase